MRSLYEWSFVMKLNKTQVFVVDFEIGLRKELASIVETREFQRSHVMIRLINYLVEQTLDNNGDRLKAYSIAVDGLGRESSFDPSSDSYPRVQVGRLRRMLEAHYAHKTDDGASCLYIPRGSYRVKLARRYAAYPELPTHRADTAQQITAFKDAEISAALAESPAGTLQKQIRAVLLGVAVGIVLALATLVIYSSLKGHSYTLHLSW
jgi:fermentation-respiration switch protein FrsA (DUF1100 family)